MPEAIGPGGRSHMLERHGAHQPPTRNPVKVRASRLTLRQSGSEAQPVCLLQSAPKAGATCQKGIGPTNPLPESREGKGFVPNLVAV